MKKYSTKKALIASLLMLCLSFTSLAGTTFAWFTDSVTSNNNLIQSGNLDVEMEYSADLEKWNVITETTNMFSDDLWEPGHVAVVYLKVKNAGSLALRYRLNVNVASETGSVNVYGEDFKLSDNIGYGVVENVTAKFDTRADAIKEVGEDKFVHLEVPYAPEKQDLYPANDIPDGKVSETVIALVVYMPDDVENDANHAKGAPIPTINLGINLFATQLVYESDSFGPDYDEPADRFIAKDEIAKFEGEEIVGSDRIIQNNGGNLEIKDTKVNQTAGNDYIIRNQSTDSEDGTIIFNNVNATSLGGGVSMFGGKTIFNSGSIVTNSTSTSGRHVFFVNNGGYLEINDGDFAFSPSNLTRKGFYVCALNGSTVVITGGNFAKPSTRGSSTASKNYKTGMYADATSSIVITGGSFAFDPTNWVADGYQAVQVDSRWFVTEKGKTPAIDTNTLVENLKSGEDVVLENDVKFDSVAESNGYGATGANVLNQILDGNGKTISAPTATGTWDSAIAVSGESTIKNLTVDAGFRGIFVKGNTGLITLENVVVEGPVYTISCDSGSKGGLLAKNSTFNGWTSYAATIGNVKFVDCKFGEGAGYAFARPYAPTVFENCEFEAGYAIDPRAAVEFINCKIGGVKLTKDNVTDLVGTTRITNVTVDGTKFVNTADAFMAALASEAEEISIVLVADVAADIGTGLKLGGANTKSITIDGNGKTLTLSSNYRSYFNMANTEGVLTIENMTLTNAHNGTHFFDYTTHFNCDVVAENVKFAKSPLVNGGVTATFNNCEFAQTGTDIYGLWVMSGANVTVNGGVVNTDRGIKIADEDSAKEETVLKVTGTDFNNEKKAAVLVTTAYGANITMTNVDIADCAADSVNAVWVDEDRVEYRHTVLVFGASVIDEP